MGADPETVLASEIAELHGAIDRAASATERMLADQAPNPEHQELCRQLAALRKRVENAQDRNGDPSALRAELATLSFFARTLETDAQQYRAGLANHAHELERQKAAERAQEERLVLAREDLVKRREALQSTILQTAARMAQQTRGECRRTLPVFTLGDGLTVCSVSVAYPRRGFRLAGHWLVTLGRSHDVLIRRE